MKKIKFKHDIDILGYGIICKGTAFKVEKYNKRFVYVKLGGCTLRLARKGDCEIFY